MTRIGCRAHDYGKLPAAELAAVLHAKGYTGAQLSGSMDPTLLLAIGAILLLIIFTAALRA